MTTYTVTVSNWNSPAFWSAISESGTGHELDFSGLGPGYSVNYDGENTSFTISDGATTYTVGESGASGTDVNLGGTTQLDFFSIIGGTAGDDTITGGAGADQIRGEGGDDLFVMSDGFGDDTIV